MNKNINAKPNLFILGAPKCGTTSIYHWLIQHPQVFFPYNEKRYWQYKEPYYYCTDLVLAPYRATEEQYREMYSNIGAHIRYAGDATPFNLFSEDAPRRIHADTPDARFIVSFRDPTEFIVSFFKDSIRWRHEEQLNFAKAVVSNRDIENDKYIPERCWYPKCMNYQVIARFSQQVTRYIEYFDRSQLFLLILDDLKSNPNKQMNALIRFLEIDAFDFDISQKYNLGVPVRNTFITESKVEQKIKKLDKLDKTKTLSRCLSTISTSVFKWLGKSVEKSITPEALYALRSAMADEVLQLEQLLSRDLSHWRSHPKNLQEAHYSSHFS